MNLLNRLQYALLRFLAEGIHSLGMGFSRRAAEFFAAAIWRFFPSRRRLAVRNVQKHLGVAEAEAVRIARQSFRENFYSFFEIFHSDFRNGPPKVRITAAPELVARMKAEPGAIVIATAHIGSWEFQAGLAAEFFPQRLRMVVVRRQRNAALNRIMSELRGRRGTEVIDHRRASSVVVPKLRESGLAAFLVDHNCNHREAVFLPFLADEAAVNAGPAMLAVRASAAVYPVFLLRDPEGEYYLDIQEPLYPAQLEGSIKEKVEAVARFYTEAVENAVREHPEQWFWMHDRWKTRKNEAPKRRKKKKREEPAED